MNALDKSTIETILSEIKAGDSTGISVKAPSNGLLDQQDASTYSIKPYDGDDGTDNDLLIVNAKHASMISVPILKEHLSYGARSFDTYLPRYTNMTRLQVEVAAAVADIDWIRLMDQNFLLQPVDILQHIGHKINIYNVVRMNTVQELNEDDISHFLLNKFKFEVHSIQAVYFCLRKSMKFSDHEMFKELYERCLAFIHDQAIDKPEDTPIDPSVFSDGIIKCRHFIESIAKHEDNVLTKVVFVKSMLDAFIPQVVKEAVLEEHTQQSSTVQPHIQPSWCEMIVSFIRSFCSMKPKQD